MKMICMTTKKRAFRPSWCSALPGTPSTGSTLRIFASLRSITLLVLFISGSAVAEFRFPMPVCAWPDAHNRSQTPASETDTLQPQNLRKPRTLK